MSTNNINILTFLEHMEKEKNIARAEVIDAIKKSIEHTAEKDGQKIEVTIDAKNGKLSIHTPLTVVDSVSDSAKEIHVNEAARFIPNPQVGDVVKKEFNPEALGHIGASVVKQALKHILRQIEKDRVFDEFKGQIGSIVVGTVRRYDHGNIIVELDRAEATLLAGERTSKDKIEIGDRIRCLLLEIENRASGPEIILSRSNPNFVKKLLESEVSEIADKTVFIAALAREAGSRTKIAVDSRDPRVDPVGACVGAGGTRVRSIVKELNDEKVDILRWYPDPVQTLREAIKPATPLNVVKDTKEKRISFEVEEKHLAKAIGHKGLNAKLTSRILGWKLDIKKHERADPLSIRKGKAAQGLVDIIPNLSPELASKLVDKGFNSLEVFNNISAENLVGAGFDPADAAMIIDLVSEARSSQGISQG
ncbi:MAG: transcription termination factor NusA [Puniceicoccales bacterium]|jgi:N utilization substance protein A|nr:transcription termination factor NusA [Puniceicoccales bacterium]